MANAEYVERLLASVKEQNGCQAWNQWRREVGWRRIDLRGADLSDADLRNANLNDIDLRDADLKRAQFMKALLQRARLEGANFRGADLRGADLSEAALEGYRLASAVLGGAMLTGVVFRGASLNRIDLASIDLTGVDFSEAYMQGTNLQACQMRGVRIDKPVRGEPIWPEMAASVWDALQEEARSPSTSADRLVELATYWPGYLVRHLLVANPNLPQEQVIALAPSFPVAFLANPVLPLWWVADSLWLPPGVATIVFAQLRKKAEWPVLAQRYAALVALLEQRCRDFWTDAGD